MFILEEEDESNLKFITCYGLSSKFILNFDKMGRKIPGRKHRGVKDPEKQAAVRLNSIKDKINAPPTKPDEQEVSKSLQRIITLKNKTKSGDFFFKKKKVRKTAKELNENESNSKKRNIEDPRFQQLPNETNKEFLFRVNKICQNVKKEAAFEDKYGVEIKRDAMGEVKVVKRSKDELELLLRKVKKEKSEKKTKKKKTTDNETPKLTKSQKWQKKKTEKKRQKKLKSAEGFEPVKDTIKFGEIVHAPPTLTAPKKVQNRTPRPGQKKLLLSAFLQKSGGDSKKQPAKEKIAKKSIDKKGKRKDLPNALRRQLDTQQKEVIGAYRLLKAKKITSR